MQCMAVMYSVLHPILMHSDVIVKFVCVELCQVISSQSNLQLTVVFTCAETWEHDPNPRRRLHACIWSSKVCSDLVLVLRSE